MINQNKSFYAKIIKVNSEENGTTSTWEDPAYSLDLQILDENLKVDSDYPVIEKVPFFVNGAGDKRGFFALPDVGAFAEVGFVYDNFKFPFVRSILPINFTLPALKKNDIKIYQSEGNFLEFSDQNQNFKSTNLTVNNTATKFTALSSFALVSQQIWIGSQTENLLQIENDLMMLITQLIAALAAHTHKQKEIVCDPETTQKCAEITANLTQIVARLTAIKKINNT